ncbi:MAG TPA: ROK family protein [Virgibacillus sp.]|nr:ROK family protein [Virgibacillus sp.]HLR69364.1 ROK family protein [Virgibacillus sp.]
MKYSVGVDIGGTKVSIAIVDSAGQMIKQSKISTNVTIPPKEMINQISQEMERIIKLSGIPLQSIIGIGIGAPGPIDISKGMIVSPPNLTNWVDIPIVEWFKEKWSLPIFLDNDANAAALGEKWIGAARNNKDFVYVTISTGIGAGIFVDGKILHGRKGNAGDIGHIVVDPSFGKCVCGQYGCIESIASGTAIAKRGSEIMGEELSTKDIFDLYVKGHADIVPFLDRIFYTLGTVCVTIINLYDTEKIIIGGGVSNVGALLFDRIEEYVCQYALNQFGRKTTIVPAKLGQEAGVVGAAALCLLENAR